jgi:hypothetical protein
VKIRRWKEIHFCNFESQFQNRAFGGLGRLSQLFLATESRAFGSLQVKIYGSLATESTDKGRKPLFLHRSKCCCSSWHEKGS